MTGRIVLILILQTVVLAAMVGMKQWTLSTGRPVLLETEPIDPRSLFRGDYVRLNYAISSLSRAELEGDDDFAQFDPVYVVLEQGDPYWEPRAMYREHPDVSADRVVIRGEVANASMPTINPETGELIEGTRVTVRYGIENYFVPEGEGREMERPEAGRIDIRVVVDDAGNAAIAGVLVDGEVRYVEKLL